MIDRSLSPEAVQARVRRRNGAEPLPGDEFVLAGLMRAQFRSFENDNYQFRVGLFDESEYEGNLSFVAAYILNPDRPDRIEWWDQNREQFSDGLQQVLDSLIARQR